MARYRDWLIGRWVGLMLVFVFVGALLLPTGAAARVEYTNDTSAAEGDPGDGLGSSGNGGDPGDLLDDGGSEWAAYPVVGSIWLLPVFASSGMPVVDAGTLQVWLQHLCANEHFRIVELGGSE